MPRLLPVLASSAFLVVLLTSPAEAGDPPKRKSGLWEIRSQMAGMPGGSPVQMCVDQASDNVMRDNSREKADCPVMEAKPRPGGFTLHAVCHHDGGVTSTTDAVMTGDFERSYKSDMTIRYNPPQHGMSDMKMTQEARWVGPCQPGQKPGDVMMPGMPPMNPNQMPSEAQMREMMKRMPAAR